MAKEIVDAIRKKEQAAEQTVKEAKLSADETVKTARNKAQEYIREKVAEAEKAAKAAAEETERNNDDGAARALQMAEQEMDAFRAHAAEKTPEAIEAVLQLMTN